MLSTVEIYEFKLTETYCLQPTPVYKKQGLISAWFNNSVDEDEEVDILQLMISKGWRLDEDSGDFLPPLIAFLTSQKVRSIEAEMRILQLFSEHNMKLKSKDFSLVCSQAKPYILVLAAVKGVITFYQIQFLDPGEIGYLFGKELLCRKVLILLALMLLNGIRPKFLGEMISFLNRSEREGELSQGLQFAWTNFRNRHQLIHG